MGCKAYCARPGQDCNISWINQHVESFCGPRFDTATIGDLRDAFRWPNVSAFQRGLTKLWYTSDNLATFPGHNGSKLRLYVGNTRNGTDFMSNVHSAFWTRQYATFAAESLHIDFVAYYADYPAMTAHDGGRKVSRGLNLRDNFDWRALPGVAATTPLSNEEKFLFHCAAFQLDCSAPGPPPLTPKCVQAVHEACQGDHGRPEACRSCVVEHKNALIQACGDIGASPCIAECFVGEGTKCEAQMEASCGHSFGDESECTSCVHAHEADLIAACGNDGSSGNICIEYCLTHAQHRARASSSPRAGLNASSHYTATVNGTSVFVHETTSGNASDPLDGCNYNIRLLQWTASWLSIDLGPGYHLPLTIEIRRIHTSSIFPVPTEARIHPASSGARVLSVSDGVVVVRVSRPSRFMVDFSPHGFDDVDTGNASAGGYTGPPMHSFAVFVNPHDDTRPDTSGADPAVIVIRPGEQVPVADNRTWSVAGGRPPVGATVYLAPGVHETARDPDTGWRVANLLPFVRYYLDADAVWHSALVSCKCHCPACPPCPLCEQQAGASGAALEGWDAPGESPWPAFTLHGSGILTGEDMSVRPYNATNPPGTCDGNDSPQAITIRGNNASIRDVTLVDFPNHHVIADVDGCDHPRSELRNIKIWGWRANGDGIHVLGGFDVRDCFVRVQDDALYMHAGKICTNQSGLGGNTTFRGLSLWNDVNGASVRVFGTGSQLLDSDVLYARSPWAWAFWGRIFSHRDCGKDSHDLLVDNVRVEDTMPTGAAFFINHGNFIDKNSTFKRPVCAAAASNKKLQSQYSNITFSNVHVAGRSTVTQCNELGASRGGCGCLPFCKPGVMPFGQPNTLFAPGPVRRLNMTLAFNNVTIAGVNVRSILQDPKYQGWFNVTREGILSLTVDGQPAALLIDSSEQ